MTTKKPPPEPQLTDEERRARRIAAWQARRAARGRGNGPVQWDIVGAGEPRGARYDVSGIPRAAGPADDIEIRHIED